MFPPYILTHLHDSSGNTMTLAINLIEREQDQAT